jgi:diadenosine tetraphosphate (Ap4A) HIT family hydrolase
MKCEFCAELADQAETHFSSIYSGLLKSRLVHRCEEFAALPTIGQLFDSSYLVIPTSHLEKYSELLPARRERASHYIETLLRGLGPTLVYEHGASSAMGGGCGIYHAHVHVVPLPREISSDELLPGVQVSRHPSIVEAWAKAEGKSEYLLVRDTHGNVGLADRDSKGGPFGSQFMRRRLAEVFELHAPWDWREYRSPETKLLRAARDLRG